MVYHRCFPYLFTHHISTHNCVHELIFNEEKNIFFDSLPIDGDWVGLVFFCLFVRGWPWKLCLARLASFPVAGQLRNFPIARMVDLIIIKLFVYCVKEEKEKSVRECRTADCNAEKGATVIYVGFGRRGWLQGWHIAGLQTLARLRL